MRLLPVKYLEKRVLIYMYRPDRLRADLKDAQALSILSEKAYPIDNADKCVAELVRRVNSQETFPHEIGLFLGYPSEDVNGFIKYGADKAKCVGTWRVYGDEEAAKKKFALYKKCTRVYKDAYRRHNSFERLVVNARADNKSKFRKAGKYYEQNSCCILERNRQHGVHGGCRCAGRKR